MNVAGACLILFSGLLTAFFLCNAENGRLACVCAILALLEDTKNAVENYSMPGEEILRCAGADALHACGYRGGSEVPQGFFELFSHCKISDKITREIFGEFARDFGKSYRAEQTARCEYYIEKIKKRKDELLLELPKKKKMIFALSLSTALCVVILIF